MTSRSIASLLVLFLVFACVMASAQTVKKTSGDADLGCIRGGDVQGLLRILSRRGRKR